MTHWRVHIAYVRVSASEFERFHALLELGSKSVVGSIDRGDCTLKDTARTLILVNMLACELHVATAVCVWCRDLYT